MAKTTNTKTSARKTKAKAAPRRRKTQKGNATTKNMAVAGIFGAACAGIGALGYKLLAL